MTIEQINEKRTELEAAVKKLCEKFELETGTAITVTGTSYGQGRAISVNTSVSIPKAPVNDKALAEAGF